ncbi:hypothetical protein C5E10_02940 [Pseudoclavibacter sp. RFBG4]|uniref:hypothetical protein n=1 Tax=Pseudoclavibacter sp. RFBG4 TaxID=2080575 RepID=UPI000CE793B9|nr:hypothetical protein [Pseudoclavibacter sp. RFBG4]PPG35708.1 hypothetical protein C5E10_02940 [Pseudoclavibacter sp. RFBG4]
MTRDPSELSRRSLLLGALGMGAFGAAVQLAFPASADSPTLLPKVGAISSPSRALFAPNEQVLGRYLMSVTGMANDIVDYHGATYGFMGGGWWRSPDTQNPKNARTMEHIATLAWFYANKRDWNPYYLDPKLLSRLEAAIGYYTSLQFDDGSYPDWRDKSSLAATTFGMGVQAEAYVALRSVMMSDQAQQQLAQSLERSVKWFMNPEARHWRTPIPYFNQVLAGLVGAQRALEALDKPTTTQDAVNERTSFLVEHGQAPAGFLHEPYGVDFGYNFTVALPDVAWLYRHTSHPALLSLVQRYVEFMRYAVIPEPGTSELFHVPALHTRGAVSKLSRSAEEFMDRGALAKDFLEQVPEIALFFPTKSEKDKVRAAFLNSKKEIPPLSKPSGDPRIWMHGVLAPDGPSKTARDQVEAALPMLTSDRFVKRALGSVGDEYLFVRRPGYYAVGVFGEWMQGENSARQLGTLWSPLMGSILVSSNDDEAGTGWETIGPGGEFSTRRSSTVGRFVDARNGSSKSTLSADELSQQSGLFSQQAESEEGASQYATGWSYWDSSLRYSFITEQEGESTHRLPLVLKPSDVLTFADGSTYSAGDADRDVTTTSIILARGRQRVLFSWGTEPRQVALSPTDHEIAGGVVHAVAIVFEKQLHLNTVFLGDDPSSPVLVEAHRHESGEVSLRVTSSPALAGGEVSFDGSVATGKVSIPGVADYCVTEQTTAASEARTSTTGPAEVRFIATNSQGSTLAETVTPIV